MKPRKKAVSRTSVCDLACEGGFEALSREDASYKETRFGSVTLSALTIKRESEHIKKQRGRYLSLSFPSPLFWVGDVRKEILYVLTLGLRFFFTSPPNRLLVAGLGNRRLTADSLGVLAADLVEATAVLPVSLDERFGIAYPTRTAVCIPDVFAKTGIESVRTIEAAAVLFEADALLALDALAACDKAKLLSVIELTDTGTVPGGGVKNGTHALSERALGIPVVAVGVPTVIRADDAHFLVPRDLEEGVRLLAELIAEGINSSFSGGENLPHTQDTLIYQLFSEENT